MPLHHSPVALWLSACSDPEGNLRQKTVNDLPVGRSGALGARLWTCAQRRSGDSAACFCAVVALALGLAQPACLQRWLAAMGKAPRTSPLLSERPYPMLFVPRVQWMRPCASSRPSSC